MGSASRRFAALLVLVGFAFVTGACGGVTQNVRAIRAYAHEDPNLKVTIDRVEDMARSLELVDRMLLGTSYTPGDMWPRRVPMTDAEYRTIKAELRDKYPYKALDNVEVPVLKCYRYHIENALSEYGPPPEKATYPSLLDALGSLNPRGKEVKAHWQAFEASIEELGQATEAEDRALSASISAAPKEKAARDADLSRARDRVARAEGERLRAEDKINKDSENLLADAQLSKGDRQQIARDAFTVLTVALRLELEALALVPIVTIQAIRSLPSAPRDLTFKPNLKIARQVWQLPAFVVGIRASFERQSALLQAIAGRLALALNTKVKDSPGMELAESAVDQIVGITLDSFRLDLNAGAEAFVFSSIGTPDRNGGDDVKYDYRGRRFKLDYQVEPIVLASARAGLVFDWIRMPGAASLSFGYATDRVWKSGGEVQATSFTEQLGVTGIASDVLDAGLGVLGVRTSVKTATFTAGQLRQVSATDVTQVSASSPLRLRYTQLDVGYDILWLLDESGALRSYMEEIVVGGRYINYELPRIVYEVEDTSTVAGKKAFTFARETPAQPVDSTFYLGHAQARIGVGDAPRWSPFLDLGIGFGAGPTEFYFLRDPNAANTAANREYVREVAMLVDGTIGGGLRVRLLPRGSRLRLDLRATYQANILYTILNHTDQGPTGRDREATFGTVDVFHSPSITLRGAL